MMQNEKTKFKKVKEWLENRWYVVAILILFTVYISFSQLLKSTKENLEILQGDSRSKSPLAESVDSTVEVVNNLIIGAIIDPDDKPIQGVSIKLAKNGEDVDVTDSSGGFAFNLRTEKIVRSNDIIEIFAEHPKYEPLSKKIIITDYKRDKVFVGRLKMNRKQEVKVKSENNKQASKHTKNEINNQGEIGSINIINAEEANIDLSKKKENE